MNKKLLTMSLISMMLVLSLSAFGQVNKKSAKARKNVAEAQKDLKEAKNDSIADLKAFKIEAENKIDENEKKIAQLKAKKTNEKMETNEKYDKKVLALEKRNNKLKRKIQQADHTKPSKWSSFKKEFNHDMNELGKAIKDIGVDNVK